MNVGYVLQRNEDGKFVAPSGSEHSYTDNLRKALVFKTAISAIKAACGNETVRSLDDLLHYE